MSNANAGIVRLDARFSGRSARLELANVWAVLRRSASVAFVAGLVTSGCSCGRQATLEISAPSNAIVGSPFSVTVTATVDGNRDRVINSPIHFTSSDTAAVLPTDYGFTPNDAGSHTFVSGITLMTAGRQSLTATMKDESALTASANVTVSATAASREP